MSVRLALFLAAGAFACSSAPHTLTVRGQPLVPNPHFAAPTGDYGTSETNPVLVASLGGRTRPENEHRYLSRLRGPDGQRVSYRRTGSCCLFPTPNGLFGENAPLDVYEVAYDGIAHPIELYLNMYDPGEAHAPLGFTLAE